nr:hypothetical protein [Tanacetum cinerariifolium]
ISNHANNLASYVRLPSSPFKCPRNGVGLPPDAYAIVNHHKVAKEIWDRVMLLMQGTKSSLQEKEFQGRQGQSYAGDSYKGNATSSGGNNAGGQARVVKCYNCQSECHMARQCTQLKKPRNAARFKEKAMLAEAQEVGQILDKKQLAFLVDPGILDGKAVHTTILNTTTFQTEDLDAYDSDFDDISNAKAVLIANLSNNGFDFISTNTSC